jgi:hypothetical protein
MEGITEAVKNIDITDSSASKRNRIQVSNTKKPLFFYVNLAKVFFFFFLFRFLCMCLFVAEKTGDAK